MKFPVDLLADVSQAELEQSAHNYMNNLLYSNPDSPEHLTLSDSTKVSIDISSVGLVPLYGCNDEHKILALFSPTDLYTAVALYLLDQWWTVEDILKTADPARDGVVEVETVGERIVLYILNRVIYRAKEMSSEEELPFLCHGEKDYAKISWNNGEAVGFYSVKPSGSLFNSTRSYQLPVMDSIFVRKCHRGKGFGLQMLEDFVLSFKEEYLGLRYPLTKAMYKVCEKYLLQYPGETDLLWEVERVGGPSQRTNIASKIQTMDLSAVSKNLSFVEESLVITEVTEKDIDMEAITPQIKGSMECRVEIVEEVTVRRTTKVSEADDVPVAARSRSSGSKRRKTGEKITEDKSEKVIRIEDIEAETPREEQVSEQQKNGVPNVSNLVQTESVHSVATEEKREDEVDNASEESAPTVTDKPATVLTSQDLEEAEVTSAPAAEESQVEDDGTQDLDNTSYDSQITVENVASELEGAEEESQEEDTAVLVVCGDVLDVYKEEEALDKVEEATQGKVSDENSEEPTQHELSLSTHATSQGDEAGKTGRTVGKTIKTVQSEIPRRRSQQHSKPEEGVKEETTAQDGRRVLRGRTVVNSPARKRKYQRHSQKVCEELDKEIEEVAEEKDSPTTEVVEESTVTEGQEAAEIATGEKNVVAVEEIAEEEKLEQLANEEQTEKHEEPGVEDTVVKESATELPDRQETEENALTKVKEDEKVTEAETSVIEDKAEDSDDEIEEPPVVQRRALRGRRKVTPKPKPTKQSKRHQQQQDKHTDEPYLGAGGSAQEEEADEQVQEHGQVEQDKMTDKPEEEIQAEELTAVGEGGAPRAGEEEDVISSAEVNVEKKVVEEEGKTEGVAETVTVVEEDKEEEEEAMIQEPDTVTAASETVMPDERQGETVAEELQENDTDSEISKLQKATVILVDLKTSCHHFSMKEAEETPAAGDCAVPEKEQMELKAAERDVSTSVAEEQTPEPEKLAVEEEEGGTQDNITEKSFNTTAEAETDELKEDSSEKEKEEIPNVDETETEEEAPVIETRVLRSESKTVEASRRSTSRSKQQQEEGNAGEDITEKEAVETETDIVEVVGEIEAVEEKPPAISETDADTEVDVSVGDDAEKNLLLTEVDEAMTLDEEETPVVETKALRSGTKTVTATPSNKTPRSRKQDEEQDEAVAENSEEEEPAVTTRSPRQGRISASATPKGKSRKTRKQIQEAEDEEEPTQHELSLSTHATSQGGEAGKTGRTVGKTIKTVQSEIPRRRSQQHSKPEEGVKEETTAQDGRRVLRGRTVVNSPARKRKYQRHSQKVCEELDKEIEEVAEEKDSPTTEVVEESTVTEGQEAAEIATGEKNVVAVEEIAEEEKLEQLANEEQTEKHEEPGVEDTVVKESATELPDRQETEENALTKVKEDEKVTEAETSVIEDKAEDSDDEIEEPPVVQRRALRGRRKVTPKPKPTKQSKRHQQQQDKHTDEPYLGAGGSAQEEEADEQVQEHGQVEQDKMTDKPEEEIQAEELTAVGEGGAPRAGEEEDVISSAEVNVEKKVVEEEGKTEGVAETVTVVEEDKEEEEEAMIQEPDTVTAASETVMPDERQGETVAEELQENDTDSEISKLQKATVILVDLKTSCHHFSMKEAEETPAAGDCAVPEKEQMELKAAERDVSTSVAEEQTPEPEKLAVEEEEGGTQDNITEKSFNTTAEAETDELKEDSSEKEKEEIPNVDETETEEEAPVIETRVLRSESKTVEASRRSTSRSKQQQEEGNAGEDITEKEAVETETDIVEVVGEIEAVEEKPPAISETDADTEVDVSVGDDAEKNLLLTEVDEAVTLDEEETPVVETRALRSGTKTVTATPSNKTPRSRKQDEEQDEAVAENSEEEEPAVTTRSPRQGRISASATPKGKSRKTRKQIQEAEDEEAGPQAAIEKTDEEIEEKTEEGIGEEIKEEAASIKEESLEPEAEVEEGKAVAEEAVSEQDVVEEQSEVMSETLADREVGVEECNDGGKPVKGGEEVEPPPVAETRALRSGGKMIKSPPKKRSKRSKQQQDDEEEEGGASVEKSTDEDEPPVETRILRRGRKSVIRSSQQLRKEEEEPKESTAEEAELEGKVEAGLGSAEKPSTEDDEGKAAEEHKVEVEKEECVAVEVGKGVSEEGTMTTTEDDENTAGEAAAAEDAIQTDPPLAKPAADSAILTHCEEEAPSAEEQQREEPQLSDLQRVTVVLVDLEKTYHKVQEETATLEEAPEEKTAAEEEDEQRELMEEETMAEEHVPGSHVGAGETEQEEVVMQEEGLGENVEDAVTVHNTEGSAKETAEVDETKSVEEEEPAGIKTRTWRSVKEAVKATPRRKSARNRKDGVQHEAEEAASENSDEEAAVRVLRRGRKSFPVTQRRATKRTHKQLQEEEAVEEREAQEQEEQAEEQQQMIDQKGEGLEDEDMTPQVENIEPEMTVEKEDAVAEEAVTQQHVPEDGQTSSADEGETQDTVEAEQSTSTSEVNDTVAGESAQEILLTAKDDETKSVSEEEEAPVVEARVLRSGGKTVRATTRRKNTKIQDKEAAGKKSTEEDEPTIEARVLRRGRKASVRRKSKRACTQLQTEEEGEESAPAVETEGEEEEAGQESHEEKGEKAEGEGKSMETEVEKDVEEEEVEGVTGGESAAGEAEQMKLEKWDSNEEAVEETDTVENPSAEVEEMNSAEEEQTPVIEKSAATLEVEPDTTIVEEEALVEDASVVSEQEAPAVTTRTLRSRTKTSHASRRSRRHKETQEVTDDSPENREETNAKEQAETKETSASGNEAELPARDATEDQAEEMADSVNDRVVEPAVEEPATEETESPEEELSESKEDKATGSSKRKRLRSRAKTVGDKEDDKAEEIQPPKRRSIRKRPRVDYRENEEEEGDMEVEEEDKVESDDPKDIKEAECPADEQIGKLEESNQEENLENNMGANESTSEKGYVLNLVIDTDEEVEKADMSQEDEEDEQNMSEEEVEPVVTGKRVLRGRAVPSVIITPRSRAKRRSAKVQRAEFLSDEESEKSPQSAQRSLRKRKRSEVTPTRKSKRHSRV